MLLSMEVIKSIVNTMILLWLAVELCVGSSAESKDMSLFGRRTVDFMCFVVLSELAPN